MATLCITARSHSAVPGGGGAGGGRGATFIILRPTTTTPHAGVAGGGPAINIYKLPSYTTTTAGVSLLAGLQHASGLFTEFRVGLRRDDPDFRLGLGYHFGVKPARSATPHSTPRRH